MIIQLTVCKNYHYEISLRAICEGGQLLMRADLVEGLISHFDTHEIHQGATVEEALSSIGKALEAAILQLQEL